MVFFLPALPEGQRTKIAHGLVRANLVIGILPSQKLPFREATSREKFSDFMELFSVGTLCSFYTAVELGGAGWKNE